MKERIYELESFCRDKNGKEWTKEDLTYVNICIHFLQHERIIHLFVTAITAFVFVFLGIINLLAFNIAISLLGFIVTIVLLCYIHYYCFLENKIQCLYSLYDVGYAHYQEKSS